MLAKFFHYFSSLQSRIGQGDPNLPSFCCRRPKRDRSRCARPALMRCLERHRRYQRLIGSGRCQPIIGRGRSVWSMGPPPPSSWGRERPPVKSTAARHFRSPRPESNEILYPLPRPYVQRGTAVLYKLGTKCRGVDGTLPHNCLAIWPPKSHLNHIAGHGPSASGVSD